MHDHKDNHTFKFPRAQSFYTLFLRSNQEQLRKMELHIGPVAGIAV